MSVATQTLQCTDTTPVMLHCSAVVCEVAGHCSTIQVAASTFLELQLVENIRHSNLSDSTPPSSPQLNSQLHLVSSSLGHYHTVPFRWDRRFPASICPILPCDTSCPTRSYLPSNLHSALVAPHLQFTNISSQALFEVSPHTCRAHQP